MEIGDRTRALVTGASSGIGRAVAVELAGRGATVGLVARDQRRLDELAKELPGEHPVLPADITERKEIDRAVGAFVDEAGGLDLLVANAGIAHYGPFVETDLERVDEMVAINVSGTIYTVRAALDRMLPAGGPGHVVIVSSGAGLRAFPHAAVYGATKASNRAFAEAMRHELANTGIDLTTVFPGEVKTDLHSHEWELMPDWRREDEAIDPAGLARKIAEAVTDGTPNVYAPPLVRLLGLNGIAPRLVDRILRRLRGTTAAPRR